MAEKVLAGKTVEVNEEGYLINPSDWSKDIAVAIAKEEGIELTEKHFTVLDYLREKVGTGETLTLRKVGKSGIADIKQLYELFPGGPLKLSTKIAGVSKPESCV
ncbi:TusE/DsrC/DsvC family sulfur relay protein [Bacteroidota bacterium]